MQGELERVLGRLCGAPTRVTGAGRTDRGVHALAQVFVADVPLRWSAQELKRALNALLPAEIWISHASDVDPGFHPRFDALDRTYFYRIGTTPASASPFLVHWCWPLGRPLELQRIVEASRVLLGEHSFRAFARAGQEERGDRCIVSDARWSAWSHAGLEFQITANRFLHRMIRYLVGTMVEIGLERRPVSDLKDLLEQRPGLETSPPAPPQGLFLAAVSYPRGVFAASNLTAGRHELPPGTL